MPKFEITPNTKIVIALEDQAEAYGISTEQMILKVLDAFRLYVNQSKIRRCERCEYDEIPKILRKFRGHVLCPICRQGLRENDWSIDDLEEGE